ncbi:MAG: cytochrome c [Planctomycetes bacterium]|nr:cytochrome c [Planctomycetota bacterium]MBI3845334.1 cytochrome c [Planctomycetota bacterium]
MKKILAVLITAFLCGAALATTTLLRRDPEKLAWEYFPDMARSPASGAQSFNPYLSNQQTDQEPIPGTVARGTERLHYTNSVRDFVRAGQELQSPFSEEKPPDLHRGQAVFTTFCQVCHGPKGEGDGPVAKRGFPAPPSLLFGKALNMRDGHIFYVISLGFRNMPSYAAEIDPLDRWQVVAYVRHLQQGP